MYVREWSSHYPSKWQQSKDKVTACLKGVNIWEQGENLPGTMTEQSSEITAFTQAAGVIQNLNQQWIWYILQIPFMGKTDSNAVQY